MFGNVKTAATDFHRWQERYARHIFIRPCYISILQIDIKIPRISYLLLAAAVILFNITDMGTASGIMKAPSEINKIDILIRFRESVPDTRRKALNARYDITLKRHFKHFRIHQLQVKLSGTESEEDVLKKFRADTHIEWAEPNYRRFPRKLSNDPLFPEQWYLKNTGQNGGVPGIDTGTAAAWNLTTGGRNVVVAVIDSGIDYTHPDIIRNMWHNSGEDWVSGSPGFNGIDDDQNGYIDDYYGIDAANDNGDPMDTLGHGTHVAGIIGAVGNNGTGISGVAWNTQLMALKFLDSDGTLADELECISYILDMKKRGVPVWVVNASFGDISYSRFEKEAFESLEKAGIMVITPAGNEGVLAASYRLEYPASYPLDNIITVAATDNTGKLAPFSNYGVHEVDLAAPGVDILSTHLHHSYKSMSGTSMATAVVSGGMALLFENEKLHITEARARILRGAQKLDYLEGRVFTEGQLNIFNSLADRSRRPFIFNISPTSGSPCSEVKIRGVDFGDGSGFMSQVTLDGIYVPAAAWSDNAIEFTIPCDISLNSDSNESHKIKIHNASGVSNAVPFDINSYRYNFSYIPISYPWNTYLILCNYDFDTVEAQVYIGPSDAWQIEPRTEVLAPRQVRYIDIRDYGLSSKKNILWVESQKDIGVDIIIFNHEIPGMSFIPAQKR